MRRRFVYFFIVLIIIAGMGVHSYFSTAPKSDLDYSRTALHELYFYSLNYFSSDLYYYRPQQELNSIISFNRQIKQTFQVESDKNKINNLENYLTSGFAKWLYQQNIQLPPEELKKIYENEKDRFYRPDQIEGARILVEYGLEAEKEIQEITDQLQANTKSFREIARDYYRSKGEDKDGYLGFFSRGKIREELFNYFFSANLEKPYFGPIETKNGYLLGKTYSIHKEGPLPLEKVEKQLINQEKEKQWKTYYQKIIAQQKTTNSIEILHTDKSCAPELSVNTLRIDQHEYTFQELLKANPYTFGNNKAYVHFEHMTQLFINQHLFFHSPEGEKIRKRKDYQQFLSDLSKDAVIEQFIKEKIVSTDITEKDLISFYNNNKELYPKAANVDIEIYSIERNPDQLTDRRKIHIQSKKSWQLAQNIHQEFRRLKASSPELRDNQLLKTHKRKKVSVERLGRVIEMDLSKKKEEGLSSLLILPDAYLFYHLTKRHPTEYKDYSEIKDQIQFDYKLFLRKELCKKHGFIYHIKETDK